MDTDLEAVTVYQANFPTATVLPVPVEVYLDRALGKPPSDAELELKRFLGRVDVLVGGPPCQGSSDLNNHTRRKDGRNALFARMARFAEVVRPDHLIIENVRGIVHDRGRVVEVTRRALSRAGYHVDCGVMPVQSLGVPQRRHRFVLVASLLRLVRVEDIIRTYANDTPRTFAWACGDLKDRVNGKPFTAAAEPSEENRARIEYLFRTGTYDLPDSERPDCHQTKPHTYRSVYGRLHSDRPAQTITTGFACMGQGRYVHPDRPRTLTPHEAARLQFIPDFFAFNGASRARLAGMIGNAVPPRLSYVVALELLR
jgi:DNA (cytosine-5)-methyltransferase 1